MKKLFTFLIFLFAGTYSFAQYFAAPDSKWIYANTSGEFPSNTMLSITEYEKDTVVEGKTCSKLSSGEIFHYRNDSVWAYSSYLNEFRLIYDFNATVGQQLTFQNVVTSTSFTVEVDSIVKVPAGTDSVNKFYVSTVIGSGFLSGYYMERFGTPYFYPDAAVVPEAPYAKCYQDLNGIIEVSGEECYQTASTLPESFQPLRQEGIWYFLSDSSFRKDIVGFAADSLSYVNGVLMIKNYPQVYYEDLHWDYCHNPHRSWMGYHMDLYPVETPDSWFLSDAYPPGSAISYNKDLEPIVFKYGAGSGESWIMYEYPDGRFIRATVDEEKDSLVYGETVSVRKISLQLHEITGAPLESDLNKVVIINSDTYGFLKALDFLNFPAHQNTVRLIGTTADGGKGMHRFSYREIYDYNVGDEFHTVKAEGGPDKPEPFTEQLVSEVLNKWEYDDSLVYEVKLCGRRINYDYINAGHDTVSIQDTIRNVYRAYDAPEIVFPDLLESYGYNSYSLSMLNDSMIYIESMPIRQYLSDSCYEDVPCTCYPIIYLTKAGGIYYDRSESVYTSLYDLEYFKKPGGEWGVPYDCDFLLPAPAAEHLSTSVYPNPMNEVVHFYVNANSTKNNLRLISASGVEVLNVHFKEHYTLERHNIEKGIYFYTITSDKGNASSGKIIVP